MNYTINVNINIPSGAEGGLSSSATGALPAPTEFARQENTSSVFTSAPEPAVFSGSEAQLTERTAPSPVPGQFSESYSSAAPEPGGVMEAGAFQENAYQEVPAPQDVSQLTATVFGAAPSPELNETRTSSGKAEIPAPDLSQENVEEKPKRSVKAEKK